MKESGSRRHRAPRLGRIGGVIFALVSLTAVVAVAMPAGAGSTKRAFRDAHGTRAFWHQTSLRTAIARSATSPAVRVRTAGVRSFTLNRAALRKVLATAPREFTRAARVRPAVVSLPAPNGRFQRFALARSAIMAPGLQRKHPAIRTYSGRGIDDSAATIHADLSPFGFHASVRSPGGGWYIDPFFRRNPNLYVSYHGQQLKKSFRFVEHALAGVRATTAVTAPEANPPTGDVLRTYRLALITDPGYSDYFGGPAAVTAAKVTLMNRVDQVYEDDLVDPHAADREQRPAQPRHLGRGDRRRTGPCGAAACFTQSQVTGCSSTTRARFVIGQIIGASNYDIGHLALGQPGGGVANLGVVGRSNKAGGCTGIPTPVGDFYAVDYVAHEMGHQFSGNHPFNGNQLNCSGGNRSAANSVEPGSGSSIMAYAGICLTDDLQPHSDPYFSQRSQQEISTYTSLEPGRRSTRCRRSSLRHFGGGNEVQVVTFGPGYSQAATIQPLSRQRSTPAPSATSRGGAEEDGNTVTIATAAARTRCSRRHRRRSPASASPATTAR